MHIKKVFVLQILFASSLFLSSLTLFSQNLNSEYIKLYNGKMIWGEEVIYHTPMFKKNYFTVDEYRYESKEVAFFYSVSARGANISQFLISNKNWFIPCAISGDIDLYFRSKRLNQRGSSTPRFYEKNWLYFSIEDGPLMRANYDNLYPIMKDSAKALIYLEKYKRSKIIEHSLYIAIVPSAIFLPFALLRIGYGFEIAQGVTGLGVYFISSWTAMHLNRNIQPKLIRSAIREYNHIINYGK